MCTLDMVKKLYEKQLANLPGDSSLKDIQVIVMTSLAQILRKPLST